MIWRPLQVALSCFAAGLWWGSVSGWLMLAAGALGLLSLLGAMARGEYVLR